MTNVLYATLAFAISFVVMDMIAVRLHVPLDRETLTEYEGGLAWFLGVEVLVLML